MLLHGQRLLKKHRMLLLRTTLGLFWQLWALLSSRFLLSRSTVFPALADGEMEPEVVFDIRQQPWGSSLVDWMKLHLKCTRAPALPR
jgi:hypothetical protein